MNKRPISVTVVGCVFVATGIIGLGYHASEFKAQIPFDYGEVWVLFVRFLAIVGGVFTLRGANWARWLLLVWMAYHVYLSVSHSLLELLMHSVILVVVGYCLFHAKASAYFRG